MSFQTLILSIVFGLAVTCLGCTNNENTPTLPEWIVSDQPTALIGVAEGDDNYMFSRIASIAVGDNGEVFVGDSREKRVHVYTPTGKFIRSIGRAGRGPGELEGISSISTAGDQLHILDPRLGRAVTYDTLGQHKETIQLAPAHGQGLPFPALSFADGVVSLTSISPRDFQDQGKIIADTLIVSLHKTGEDIASELSRIASYPRIGIEHSGSVRFPYLPFSVSPTLDSKGDILVMGSGLDPQLELVFSDGSKEIVPLPINRSQPSPEQIRQFREDRLAGLEGSRRERTLKYLELAPMPDYLPAYDKSKIDTEGFIWLNVYEYSNLQQNRWVIISTDGQQVATVKLPDSFEPHFIGKNRITGVWRDSTGINFVHTYELNRLAN